MTATAAEGAPAVSRGAGSGAGRGTSRVAMRWWDVGAGATAVVLVVLALASEAGSSGDGGSAVGSRPLALAATGLFVLTWLLLARPVVRRDDDRVGRAEVVVVAAVVVVGGLAVAGAPPLAVVQAFLMPLLWTVLPTPRSAIVANVLLCLAISAGFVVSLGWSPDTLATAATSEGLSLLFSIALGFWITSIAHTGVERGRLLDELRAAQDELATRHREAGTVAERERLAREIHDTVAQSLTGLVMLSQQARSSVAAGDAAAGLAQLELIESSARDALTDARTLVAATASSGLDSGDLADALRRLAARFSRESGVAVTVDVEPGLALPRDHQVVVIRAAQEALANVRKHSGSRSAHVALARGDDVAEGSGTVGAVVLSVRDEGRGFDPAAARDGFGLDGLDERLRLAGGRLEVVSGAAGTTVTAHLPGGERS
ncbi:sensor histidine kinase [Frigoribacterium sp. PvP032]|uniref:sensor histidine kinase n=1 Tax=Frigoribacterium sp. PvP032 TaxID=2806589 RepID=UPI001AE4AF62|nr:sensor histidine kinase [Frigoribacterium sp. PvP032]MBP1190087.1 signal transduction histidine kinase [Frigoribacterium sp. PvP032]